MKFKIVCGMAVMMSTVISAQSFQRSAVSIGEVNTGYSIRGGVTAITQSSDVATITSLNSVACPADNDSYMRRFDLDGDHSILSNFDVESVDFGIETATGIGGVQDIIVNLYSIPNASALVFANLTLVGSNTVSVVDGVMTMQNVLVSGSVDGSLDDLVVEILANDFTNVTTFFIGSNANGQLKPSFLSSAGCGAAEPTDIGTLGFPGMHMIFVVNGTVGPTEADLAVTVSNNASTPINIGDQYTYSLNASNAGPSDATGVTVTNTLSLNLDYISNTCGASVAGNTVTWNIGNLASSSNTNCDINVEVLSAGNLNSSASISGNETDPVAANNASGSNLAGVPRIIPTLGTYGLILLILSMLFVFNRRKTSVN